jgi:hypothetical protein
MPRQANEKTGTVLFSNCTTGGATDRPAVVAFPFVEDRKSPVPKGVVLNFADTFVSEADESTTGPASFIAMDPDGKPILVDQHV